jgi:hypothetical protein
MVTMTKTHYNVVILGIKPLLVESPQEALTIPYLRVFLVLDDVEARVKLAALLR